MLNKKPITLKLLVIMGAILLFEFIDFWFINFLEESLEFQLQTKIVLDLLFSLLFIGPIILFFLYLLHQREGEYSKLINSIPDGVLIQKDKEIIDSNERGIRMLGGQKPEDIIGKSVYEFINTGDEQSLASHKELVNNPDEAAQYHYQKLITLEGEEIEVEVTGVPIIYHGEKCILTIDRDVTEKKKKEEAFREIQQRYEMIANNMHDFITLINNQGVLEYASPSHKRLLGVNLNVDKEHNILELIHQEDRSTVQDIITEVMLRKEKHFGARIDFRLNHMFNGKDVWLEAELINVSEDGKEKVLFISREITQRKELEEKLKQMAYYDNLTDLPNRKLLERSLKSSIARAKRFNHQIVILFIDLDGFKDVNDSLGHEAGDQLLKLISERLTNIVREEDIVARLGGDEFVIVLEEATDLDIEDFSGRIINTISQPIKLGENEVTVSPSIGISVFPDHGDHKEELLNKADHAMYVAKNKGKNTYQVFYDDMPSIQELKKNPISRFLNQFISK